MYMSNQSEIQIELIRSEIFIKPDENGGQVSVFL